MSVCSNVTPERCADLASIVNGTPAVINEVCLIQTLRSDIEPAILGPRTRSPLVLPVFYSIENGNDDETGTLNLGEAVLRQREVNTVMGVLCNNGILVTALHNHWLAEEPRLMYMHRQAVMDPVRFLQISQEALNAAGVVTRPL